LNPSYHIPPLAQVLSKGRSGYCRGKREGNSTHENALSVWNSTGTGRKTLGVDAGDVTKNYHGELY